MYSTLVYTVKIVYLHDKEFEFSISLVTRHMKWTFSLSMINKLGIVKIKVALIITAESVFMLL
jgi:hypothetical protein